MIYIRKQSCQEILDITLSPGVSVQLFGKQGYTRSQLQAINKLLATNNCIIHLDCDFGEFNEENGLIYNLHIIEYLTNVRQLFITNYSYKVELDSIEFVLHTPRLQCLSLSGQIKNNISFQSLLKLNDLDTLLFGEYMNLSKKQCQTINCLTNLKELSVKGLDAKCLLPNSNMIRLSIYSKLKNMDSLPHIFPNLEYLYLRRQTNCSDFSWISKCFKLKKLYLHWIYGLEKLPDLSNIQNLELLELAGCPNLRDGMEGLASLHNLKRFFATELTQLTTEVFESTLPYLKNLKSVYIYFRNNNAENKAMDGLMKKYNWNSLPIY